MSPPRIITGYLRAWSAGDQSARDQLMPLVIEELRRIAKRRFDRERPGHTLQPTALVNELFLDFAGRRQVRWKNRLQFFGFAAQTMRRILIDHARRQQAEKRGPGVERLPIDASLSLAAVRGDDLVALDEALDALKKMDERQHQIVELRFFGGLRVEEVAELLNVSEATVNRGWASARAWLRRELRKGR